MRNYYQLHGTFGGDFNGKREYNFYDKQAAESFADRFKGHIAVSGHFIVWI